MNNFTISRTFNAPRRLVFDCWVQPQHFEKWFAPADCDSKLLHADVRPGGHYQQKLRFSDGTEFYTKTVFRQINPIDELLLVTSFCDLDGEMAKHPFSPKWPDELLTTVTFTDDGKGTKVTVVWEPLNATAEEVACFIESIPSCNIGWTGTFDRLESELQHSLAAS